MAEEQCHFKSHLPAGDCEDIQIIIIIIIKAINCTPAKALKQNPQQQRIAVET
jgi:hypothetical protein